MRWVVTDVEAGSRLDHFVARRLGLSHAAARRRVDEHVVRIDGKRARKGALLAAGQSVTIDAPAGAALEPDRTTPPVPEPDAPLHVLHRDDLFVALAKPPGTPTHPLRAGETGTLANALAARHPECAAASDDAREGGLAHRLDADTSGAILAARTPEAYRFLRAAFAAHAVEKTYLALVAGDPPERGAIDRPVAHDPRDPRRALTTGHYDDAASKARPARTDWEVLARSPDRSVTLVRARAATGRLHQIRVHLAALGHPLVGDALYGGPPALPGAPGHFLHAESLRLPHPRGGTLAITAPLPPERRDALARLGIAVP